MAAFFQGRGLAYRIGGNVDDAHDIGWTSYSITTAEWGMLLGPGHLERVSLDVLRSSGVFSRVIEMVPGRLAFLQVTPDPLNDLSDEFEHLLFGSTPASSAGASYVPSCRSRRRARSYRWSCLRHA